MPVLLAKAAAVSSLLVTVGLVLTRPRLGPRLRVGPALAAAAGVTLMFAAGFVRFDDITRASRTLWEPFVTIASIMLMAAAAHRSGVLDRLATSVIPLARGSAGRLFGVIFFVSAATAAVLNNDSAVLLLTPVVVLSIRRLYPDREELLQPFAFAVFMAAGVAPLVISNPMNMIVAGYADIGFNAYAVRMLPISLAGWVVSFLVLRLCFRKQLADVPLVSPPRDTSNWSRIQINILALLLVVLVSYPVASYFGYPVWAVAVSGAVAATVLTLWGGTTSPRQLVISGVSWETLAFLMGIFIIALGLREAGVITLLGSLYEEAGVGVVGGVSAFGSALINNHPMALINVVTIRGLETVGREDIFAALVGGDLGPRLLPIGSLAGLLWLSALRRMHVEIPLKTFVSVGAAVTVPSLAVSLLMLHYL